MHDEISLKVAVETIRESVEFLKSNKFCDEEESKKLSWIVDMVDLLYFEESSRIIWEDISA